jgi:hypothetical protein
MPSTTPAAFARREVEGHCGRASDGAGAITIASGVSRAGGLVIGAIDETGQEKAGQATAGVKRQYLWCVGKVANGINTVHLSYVRDKTGHVLIGARQWIPREQIEDPARSLVTGLPLDLEFRTKGQLAIDISTDAARHRLPPPRSAYPPPPGGRRAGLPHCHVPEGQLLTKTRLIRAAGLRWPWFHKRARLARAAGIAQAS